MTIVLDAGALIALERDRRDLWAVLRLAAVRGDRVLVPSTAIAQVWRGGARQARLGQALAQCSVAPLDPVARDVGEVCARARTTDVVDAHVALVAVRHGDVLYTSDPDDLERLLRVFDDDPPVLIGI